MNRWEPSALERCACCRTIRTPSARWPYSLLKHCSSIEHVTNRFNITARALRQRINHERKQALAVPPTDDAGRPYQVWFRLQDHRGVVPSFVGTYTDQDAACLRARQHVLAQGQGVAWVISLGQNENVFYTTVHDFPTHQES